MRSSRSHALVLTSSLACAALVFAESGHGQEQQTSAADAPRPAATGQRLSLQDAVAQALSSSSRIRAAAADRAAQAEKRRGSWSDVGPRLSATYNEAHYKEPETAQFGPASILTRPEVARTGSLMVAQPLTSLWGLVEKARYEGVQLEMKDASLKITRGDVGYAAAEAWLSAYNIQRQVEIAEASVAAAESQRKDGASLERAGRMNRGDLLKLDLAVSQAKSGLAQARAARQITFGTLKEATGVPLDQTLTLDDALPNVSTPAPEEAAAIREALGKRQEIQQAKNGVETASFAKELAYTNFTPTISAFWKWDHTYGELSALAGDRDTKYYGLQASWDIWNNGSHVFAVREAAENVVKAEEMAKGVDQNIRLDVLQSVANLKAAQETLALAQAAVSQAEEAYRIEQARFKTGSRSATDLILAETSQTSARGSLVSARTGLVLWQLRTQKALGSEQPNL